MVVGVETVDGVKADVIKAAYEAAQVAVRRTRTLSYQFWQGRID